LDDIRLWCYAARRKTVRAANQERIGTSGDAGGDNEGEILPVVLVFT
jgi:hypothetical protein